MENYNEKLTYEYRSLVLELFKNVSGQESDRDVSTALIFAKAKEKEFTDRTEMTTEWLRKRVYRPDVYKVMPQWIAKAAYFCLLDLSDWVPSSSNIWFAMIGLFIRIEGGKKPNYDELVKKLPDALNVKQGQDWLRICIELVKKQQEKD
ncbi:hypothetical protein MACH09_46620 [Vibrio sp. MACH09]|uniref:hypothetical protein n=1 Tax=Vibrio sp. MACH09 TaxID=3025122 RepID=UPI00278F768E|nr:hypothetical protein [Vibrio sp. MACH09]GLO64154.1 hypothetical protein MACH09_46620 [Vibrio sp. MACH09]